MTEYPNWFIENSLKNFEQILAPEFSARPLRALQIGAYTGDASLWIGNNVLSHPDSALVDVDTWEGSDEVAHRSLDWVSVENVYDAKTSELRKNRKVIKYKSTSDQFFKTNREFYDFIYVDGDHTSYGVIKDAVNSFEVLKVGGILAFDDYEWRGGARDIDRPKKAINAFLDIYSDKLVIVLSAYQCWIRRIK